MAHKSYSASAPGSLMILGEHAVLAGKPAIVAAVNKRLRVELVPNLSQQITIQDQVLGGLQQSLDNIQIVAPFAFVLSAILLFQPRIKTGFNLNITAEFSSVMGLGSSAAVTAATVAVLANWLDEKPLAPTEIFSLARQAILSVQGIGSGADLAASVYGGVISYEMTPCKIIPLPIIPDLTAVYCGYKKSTHEVIAIVNAAKRQQPQLFDNIFTAMHDCVVAAITAIKANDWQALGKIFQQHQSLQRDLGTSDQLLDTLISQLAACTDILGAKISGSGLGDCVIGLGKLPAQIFPRDSLQLQQGIVQISIRVDQQGIICN